MDSCRLRYRRDGAKPEWRYAGDPAGIASHLIVRLKHESERPRAYATGLAPARSQESADWGVWGSFAPPQRP